MLQYNCWKKWEYHRTYNRQVMGNTSRNIDVDYEHSILYCWFHRVGKFGKCTSIPASSRWGKSGWPAQDALPDRDPEERKMEVCCIGPTSVAPKVLMKLQSATKRIETTVLGQRWSPADLSLKKFSLRFLVDPVVWARRLHRLQAGRSYSGTSAWVPTMTYWILQIDRNSKTGFEEARSLRSTLAHLVRVFHGHETCLQDLHLLAHLPGNSSTKHLFDINWQLYIYIYHGYDIDGQIPVFDLLQTNPNQRWQPRKNRMISLFASPHSKGFSNRFWMISATFWNQNSINDGEILSQKLINQGFFHYFWCLTPTFDWLHCAFDG